MEIQEPPERQDGGNRFQDVVHDHPQDVPLTKKSLDTHWMTTFELLRKPDPHQYKTRNARDVLDCTADVKKEQKKMEVRQIRGKHRQVWERQRQEEMDWERKLREKQEEWERRQVEEQERERQDQR